MWWSLITNILQFDTCKYWNAGSNCWLGLFQLNSHPHRLHLGTHFNTICFSVWKCIQRLVCLNEIFFLIHFTFRSRTLLYQYNFFYNHVIIYIHEPGKYSPPVSGAPYNSYPSVPLTVCRMHSGGTVDRFSRYVRLITLYDDGETK